MAVSAVTNHIVACLFVAFLIATLNAWYVPLVDAEDMGDLELSCLMDVDVRQCLLFKTKSNSRELVEYGCCAIVKNRCDKKVACQFSKVCTNIIRCPAALEEPKFKLPPPGPPMSRLREGLVGEDGADDDADVDDDLEDDEEQYMEDKDDELEAEIDEILAEEDSYNSDGF